MPAVVYPTSLPPPSVPWAVLLRERAARSSLAGDPQARRRWRDAIADVTSATWHYSAAEMAVWREWWHDTLADGQLWFAKEAPGPGGWVDRVMRFRPASVRVQSLGNGVCRVTAQLEVRGRSAPPRTSDVLFYDSFTGEAGTLMADRAPDIYPAGFVYAPLQNGPGMRLDGDGNAMSVGNDSYWHSGNELDVPLPRPWSMTLVATPYFDVADEAAKFRVIASETDYAELIMLSSALGTPAMQFENAFIARAYPCSQAEHTLRVVFNDDDTATSFLDGVEQETFACEAPAIAADFRVDVSADPFGTCLINSVLVQLEEA
jgi:hypothetical protein